MILLGDCRDLLPTLPAASARTCLTHPPYWQAHGDPELGGESTEAAYLTHLVDALHGVRRVLQPDGDLWLLLDTSTVVPVLIDDGWRWTHTLLYDGQCLMHFGPRSGPLPETGPDVSVPVVAFDYYLPWPAALVARCLVASTSEGDLVLDPFCGVGTTGRVALATGRRFVGIERSPIAYAAACVYVQ